MNKAEVLNWISSTDEGKEFEQELTAGLKNSKDKLLSEKKELSTKYAEMERAYFEKENSFKQDLISKNEHIRDMQIDNVIRDYNILPVMKDTFISRLERSGEFSIDQNNQLLIGSEPLSSIMEVLSTSEEFKHYASAPNNNGGGALGSNMSRDFTGDYSSMSREQLLSQFNN